jgi:hypothetical protein
MIFQGCQLSQGHSEHRMLYDILRLAFHEESYVIMHLANQLSTAGVLKQVLNNGFIVVM